MASLGWLHLSDLHQGMDGQSWLWPNVREQLYDDLRKLHRLCGPWDVVLFTGDLTQRASPYRKVVDAAFASYTDWTGAHPLPRPAAITPGLLPGDFAATIESEARGSVSWG